MVLPQEARRANEVLLVENTIGHGILTSGERLAGDVREDLAADLVDAEDARRLEPDALQVPEERVDRGRPRARATPHGVADTDSLVEIATEGDYLRHAPRLSHVDVYSDPDFFLAAIAPSSARAAAIRSAPVFA